MNKEKLLIYLNPLLFIGVHYICHIPSTSKDNENIKVVTK